MPRISPGVLLLALLAGCARPEPDAAAPRADASSPPPETQPTERRTVPEPVARDTEPWVPIRPVLAPAGTWTAGIVRERRPMAGVATQTDVRVGRHAEFERIVLEFAGEVPGYHVEYVDRPVRQCGSGNEVPVAGDAWLSIVLEPARAHDEQGRPTVQRRDLRPAYPLLRELKLICDFEAQLGWVAGVSTPNEFRVLELSSPSRLVVDVRR